MADRDGTAQRFECPRCGSDEWSYCDYGGCSGCRPHEERDDRIAWWVGWAMTTPLRHLSTFGRST